MSEPKFTPSPWEVDEPIKSIATGELMYHVKGPNLITDFEDWGFTKADAHLIAAAPRMYDALLSASRVFRMYEEHHALKGAMDKAEANGSIADDIEKLLAEARGEG